MLEKLHRKALMNVVQIFKNLRNFVKILENNQINNGKDYLNIREIKKF